MAAIRYTCAGCGEVHEGLPDVGFEAPDLYASLTDEQRGARATLSADFCTVDEHHFERDPGREGELDRRRVRTDGDAQASLLVALSAGGDPGEPLGRDDQSARRRIEIGPFGRLVLVRVR